MTITLRAAAAAILPCLLLGLAPPAPAQDALEDLGAEFDRDRPVSLVADTIEYDSTTGRLIASGNVEVFYGERTLTAERIVYDDTTGRITGEGNIILRDPTGATVFADVADLDVELRDGLIAGAQAILGGDTTAKLAAVEARRVEERYNVLAKAVYSPCIVCEEDPTPLWRIRARRVIHDEEANTVHYESAYFDLFGVPVAYLPYFSHPDPTVERATGFLVPDFRRSGNYGFGVRVPYYVVIDEQSDVVLQPFVSTKEGFLGDAEYRRVFDTGGMRVRGSLTYTDFTGDQRLQGHLDTDGLFRLDQLDQGAFWGWNVEFTSDDAYLRFFDFSDADRLTSEAFVRNYWPDGFYDLTGVYFQSLRDDEPAGDIPRVLPDFQARRSFGEPLLDGEIGVFLDTASLFRNRGEDVTRLSLGLDWEREVILPVGLALRGFAEARGDMFLTFDDEGAGRDETQGRFVPMAGAEARYPLIWEMATGGAHVVEPIAQFVVTPYGLNDERFPNEDSQQTEFGEKNLFDVNRFSGLDAVEEGPRLNLGVNYEYVSDFGLDVNATAGRIVRFADADEFLPGTGLNGDTSDWVAGWGASYRGIVSIRQRLRVDDDLDVNRNEVFASVAYGGASLSTGYVFLEESPLAGAPDAREEVTALAALQVTPEWGVGSFVQRDLEEKEFVEVGGTLSYANECCAVDLFLRRRFTESEDNPADTSIGVQVRLLTLGTSERRTSLLGSTSFSDLWTRTADELPRPGRGE